MTNQFVGVLIKFRTEEVAFMCDIQVMYYQMQVHAEQRSVLRFLWCEDVNLGGNLLEHEMFVHVFGGSSSPVCCHYALRKTAIDNEIRFG